VQITVNLRHIDWSPSNPGLGKTFSNVCVDRKQDERNSLEAMHTGDVYKGMEIKIHQGPAKMHHGVVIQTHEKDGKISFIAHTTTCTVNYKLKLDVDAVTELQ
jgi:hypothetical protein